MSGHEISRLRYGLQLIMARYTRIINCRPCCNLDLRHHVLSVTRLKARTPVYHGMKTVYGTDDKEQPQTAEEGRVHLTIIRYEFDTGYHAIHLKYRRVIRIFWSVRVTTVETYVENV